MFKTNHFVIFKESQRGVSLSQEGLQKNPLRHFRLPSIRSSFSYLKIFLKTKVTGSVPRLVVGIMVLLITEWYIVIR